MNIPPPLTGSSSSNGSLIFTHKEQRAFEGLVKNFHKSAKEPKYSEGGSEPPEASDKSYDGGRPSIWPNWAALVVGFLLGVILTSLSLYLPIGVPVALFVALIAGVWLAIKHRIR